VGGENIIKYNNFRIIGQGKKLNFYPLKFSNHTGGAGATRLRGTHIAGATL
jgi:hypothetical protein